jgi:SpoIID/LytB domain protein
VHVEVLGRGPGGRVIGVRVSGTSGSLEILQELPVRRAFRNLLSGLFVLDAKKNARGELAELTFRGGGWGHGVGMCQMGAIGRAERGQSYRQILEHYYGGAVVEALY